MKIIFLLFITMISITPALGYQYRVQQTVKHIIHIVTIDPKECDINFVKSYNSVIGRETISSIAERSDGQIAINAGFFEIGHGEDGMPSGTLIIDGKIYGLKNNFHSALIKTSSGLLEIQSLNPKIYLESAQENIQITKVNQQDNGIILFTDTYGSRTLTNFQTRKEIAFDALGNPINIYEHGNTLIPAQGFVVSLPKAFSLDEKIKLNIEESIKPEKAISIISGIPLLVFSGEIEKNILDKQSSFYLKPHARTAIGLKKDGTIVIIVAEHSYKRDLNTMTLKEVKSLIHNKEITQKYKKNLLEINLKQLEEIIQEEIGAMNDIHGLTILELAQLMKSLECNYAINLDGGGSSSLWIEGKVVNKTIGDVDESHGKEVIRPISDAIVFKKK